MKRNLFPFCKSLLGLPLLTLGTLATAAETGDIVVTASRTPETVNESLTAVSVLTRDDIQRSAARDLPSLLARIPGVQFNSAGGLGKQSNVYLRGTESDHSLILIDGVRVGSATSGTAALQFIPLSQIERIEVVQGPRSSLYGAEALGGVIQIFTRGEGQGMRSEVQLGSHETARLTQSFLHQDETTRAGLSASLLDTQGFNAQKEAQRDDDGYDNKSLTASVEQLWGEQWRGGASIFRAQGSNEYDNRFDPPETVLLDEYVQQVISGHLGYAASEQLDVQLHLSQSRDESNNLRNNQPDGRFITDRYQATLQGDYQLTPSHLLTLGLDYYQDQVDSSTEFEEDERANRALFAQWQGQQGPVDWQLSARHDDNDAVGDQTTWNLAAGYWFSSAFKAYAALGTAFKSPTFNELYFPNVGFFRGNPELDVERARSWEVGFKGALGAGQWRLTYFQNDVKDLITYDAAQATSINVGQAEIDGVELELKTQWEQWRGELAATYLNAEDADTGNELSRRPQWSGHAAIGYAWSRYVADLSLLAQEESFNDARNSTELAGFGVLAAGLAWTPAEHWQVKAEVLNLLDKDYELLAGYNTEGRSYWLTLAYQR